MPERIYLTETSEELRQKAQGMTDAKAGLVLAPYRGQWLRVTGLVQEVQEWGSTVTVSARVTPFSVASLAFSENVDRVRLINQGEGITVSGTISSIIASGVLLHDCELHTVLSAGDWVDTLPEDVRRVWAEYARFMRSAQPQLRENPQSDDSQKLVVQSKQLGADLTPVATAQVARSGNITIDEATRFSRAIIAGWPDATEAFARDKALAFFPDKNVPKHWFLGIFRSIRGERKRGVQTKNRD